MVFLGAVALSACGGGGSDDEAKARTTTTNAAPTGVVVVTETGSPRYTERALGTVRIERSTGTLVDEANFSEDERVTLRRDLEAGAYRALAWRRVCLPKCPGDVDEPSDICGTQFTVDAGRTLRLVLERTSEDSCTLAIAP